MIVSCWICEDFSGEIKIDPNEVVELKWFDINEMPKEIESTVRKSINDFIKYIKERDKI